MNSDTAISAPDVKFRPTPAGHYITFMCPRCAKKKDSHGRKLQRVLGLRTWVCRGCAS